MAKRAHSATRREESLSRDRIIEASIELLDRSGEEGLTFRALSEHLATGPGAIYWHIANKSELLTAACDAVIARTINETVVTTPESTIRAVALAIFDVIDEHPWVGSALTSAAVLSPIVRILETHRSAGSRAWRPRRATVGSRGCVDGLTSLASAGRMRPTDSSPAGTVLIDRTSLHSVSTAWSQLDPKDYPFARSVAVRIRDHDDREDFLAGIDLILRGIDARSGKRKSRATVR